MQQMAFLQVEQPTEYHPKVRDLHAGERPVNRLREVGPTSISTTELLACLLQTPDALHQAQELLVQFRGLPGLVNAADAEIMRRKDALGKQIPRRHSAGCAGVPEG
jgi:DNA repair protein RadC